MTEVKIGDMILYKERYKTFLAVVTGKAQSVPDAFHVRQIGSGGMQTIVFSQIIKKVDTLNIKEKNDYKEWKYR